MYWIDEPNAIICTILVGRCIALFVINNDGFLNVDDSMNINWDMDNSQAQAD